MRLLWSLVLLVACSSVDTEEALTPSSPFPAAALASIASGSLRAELRTRPDQPPLRGPVDAEVRLRDAQGTPAAGRQPWVSAWMPAMGHGNHGEVTAEETGDGVYLLHGLELPMPGRWEVLVKVGDEQLALPVDVQ